MTDDQKLFDELTAEIKDLRQKVGEYYVIWFEAYDRLRAAEEQRNDVWERMMQEKLS
jgi:hypothetical protein